MEAQSFGIPVIATDIGGVKEVVVEGTGSLLNVNFDPEGLAEMIEHYQSLSEKETDKIKANAIKNWDSKFNASANYNNFIIKVNSIFASANKEINYVET
jgi:colanic acid/amylovoran biosynthesis glycosyltransferase